METLNPELKQFLDHFFKKYKFKVRTDNLRLEMNIETDLNIFDVDADALISEFVTDFKIDYSDFDWNKYGYPTGSTFIYLMKRIFKNKKWLDKISEKQSYTTFKIKNLQDAVVSGKLF